MTAVDLSLDPDYEPGATREARLMWRRLEYLRCQHSAAYYINRWVYCKDMNAGDAAPLVKMTLYDCQEDLLVRVFQHKHTLVVKTRRLGFTTVMCAVADWGCRFHPNYRVVLLNESKDRAIELMIMQIRDELNPMLPEWLRDAPSGIINRGDLIRYGTASTIAPAALGNGSPGRGDTVNLVVADEWATYKNPGIVFSSISPAVEGAGRRMVMGSTGVETDTSLEELWKEAPDKGIHRVFYGYFSRPDRTEDDYQRELKKYGSLAMAINYPKTVDEAFKRSSRRVFDQARLHELANNCVPPVAALGWNDKTDRFELCDDDNRLDAVLQVWEWPQPHADYGCGADVAHGVEHGHYAAAMVLKVVPGEAAKVVAVLRLRAAPGTYGVMLDVLGRLYNVAVVAPETLGGGQATLSEMVRHTRYPRLFRHWIFDQVKQKRTERWGYNTNLKTKPEARDRLDRAIRDKMFDCRCAEAVNEMSRYMYVDKPDGKPTGETAGKPYDDLVDAAMIAMAVHHDMIVFPRRYPKVRAEKSLVAKMLSMEYWKELAEASRNVEPGMIGPSPAGEGYRHVS